MLKLLDNQTFLKSGIIILTSVTVALLAASILKVNQQSQPEQLSSSPNLTLDNLSLDKLPENKQFIKNNLKNYQELNQQNLNSSNKTTQTDNYPKLKP